MHYYLCIAVQPPFGFIDKGYYSFSENKNFESCYLKTAQNTDRTLDF